jgi:S1-C subfamily serine protease
MSWSKAAFVALLGVMGCRGSAYPERPSAMAIFDQVAPSVVAITNDDSADREEEARDLEKSMGDDAKAPRHVVDVSMRKQTDPDGTGFMIEGGFIVTAAHVVDRPDRLKITTRAGKTVEATLERIDEVRDIALLKAKVALPEVPPIGIEDSDVPVGEPLWAMGHTGRGYWNLAWGMSEGIASGVVDVAGARLILFDTAVYPGFSGGPVVSYRHGEPRVAGINHAILYTTALFSTPVFSGVAASELKDFVAGKKTATEGRIATYAKEQRQHAFAQLFITDKLSVQKAPSGEQIAYLKGDTRAMDVRNEARIPCVAMLFGLGQGPNTVTFQIKAPKGGIVATQAEKIEIGIGERVHFHSTQLVFTPKEEGRHVLEVLVGTKSIGRAAIMLEVQGVDEGLHDHEANVASDDGDPDVDLVVAQGAESEPTLSLAGIRSAWVEKSLPRRVEYTFFARGSRGWSGRNVLITAYLVDDDGKIVGTSFGCLENEIRPEHTWTCTAVANRNSPLLAKAGTYDVVLALNGKPVAWWPMDAREKKGAPSIQDMERWLDQVRKSPKK